jgi:broad specificity phosphatase PhoE
MIYIVRHGWSAATNNVMLFAQMDPTEIPLTVFGYEQSKFSGQLVGNNISTTEPKPILLYYSTHRRIRQSTHAFLEGFKGISNNENFPILRIKGHQGIVERDHGAFDGKSPEEQRKLNSSIYELLNYGNSEQRYRTKMPPRESGGTEGESLEDVAIRIKNFIKEDLDPFKQTHHIIIVTHGGILSAIVNNAWDEGESSWIGMGQLRVPPTGTVVLINPDDPKNGSLSYIPLSREQLGLELADPFKHLEGNDIIVEYDNITNNCFYLDSGFTK